MRFKAAFTLICMSPINQLLMILSTRQTPGPGKIISAFLLAGMLAATLDGLAAIIYYLAQGGKNPAAVFKFIASGVFGKKAFSGGNIMIAWGVAFHYLIAFGFTLIFFMLFNKIDWLKKNVITGGLVYGLVVWLVMNQVVLPLSNAPALPFKLTSALINMLILMVCIGLPLSIMANKHYLYKK